MPIIVRPFDGEHIKHRNSEMIDEQQFEKTSKLIESVRKNPCLYDKRHSMYYNKLKRNKTWEDIALEMEITPTECRHKYKSLRERYSRELRKESLPSGSGASQTSEWDLMPELEFLRDSIAQKRVGVTPESSSPAKKAKDDSGGGVLQNTEHNLTSEFKLLRNSVPQKRVDRKTSDSSLPAKNAKVGSFSNLVEKFTEIIQKFESTTAEEDLDTTFLRTIHGMMQDLPEEAKDSYKALMILELNKFREKYRNSTK